MGLVGCGGRGTGAASQALKADDFAELTAVADVDQARVDDSLEQLTKINGAKVKVEPKNVFLGLDAYQKVIDSGVDVVILTTPPGFSAGSSASLYRSRQTCVLRKADCGGCLRGSRRA